MAVTAITPLSLVMDTVSADLPDSAGVICDTPSHGWSVLALGNNGDRLIMKFLDDGNTATITVKAGDRPPSQRTGLGDVAFSLGAADVKYICVDASRFLQDDGTILVIPSGTGSAATKMAAFILPKG